MTGDQMIEYAAEQDVIRIMCEALEDSVALVPSNIAFIRADKFCEEWVVYTAMGSIPLVFYFTGAIVLNTAVYDVAALAWITDKAKLIELKARMQ